MISLMSLVLDEPILDAIDRAHLDYEQPVILYDLRRVRERLAWLKELESTHANVKFLFAHKSSPFREVSAIVAETISGFDVSNRSELEQVRPFASGNIVSLAGPSWHAAPLALDDLDTVLFSASTPVQLAAARELVRRGPAGKRVLGVRLRVGESADDQPPSGRLATRFGFHSLADAIREGFDPEEIGLVHVHRGWDDNGLPAYEANLKRIVAEIAQTGAAVRYVNLGGGLHRLGEAGLVELIARARAIVPSGVTLLFEPGRLCLQWAGFAVCRVIDTFRSPEGPAVVVDASQGCHFKWSEPAFLLPRSATGDVEPITIYGSTCDESDLIGRFCMRTTNTHFSPGMFMLFGEVAGYSGAWNKGFNGIGECDVRFVDA